MELIPKGEIQRHTTYASETNSYWAAYKVRQKYPNEYMVIGTSADTYSNDLYNNYMVGKIDYNTWAYKG